MKTIRKEPSTRYKNIAEILNELLPLAEKFGKRYKPNFIQQNKVMGMFLMYPEEHQVDFKHLVEEFAQKVTDSRGI